MGAGSLAIKSADTDEAPCCGGDVDGSWTKLLGFLFFFLNHLITFKLAIDRLRDGEMARN
jgi:hypothetical protein